MRSSLPEVQDKLGRSIFLRCLRLVRVVQGVPDLASAGITLFLPRTTSAGPKFSVLQHLVSNPV
jgi:hypothetical protein